MKNSQLDIKKDTILNLEKKPPCIYDAIEANRTKRANTHKNALEDYYTNNIENHILNYNKVGLSFLVIKENTLKEDNVQVNLLMDYIKDKGFSVRINSFRDSENVAIDWDSYINYGKKDNGDGFFDKLKIENGSYDISAFEKIERYVHETIVPLILQEDDRGYKYMQIELPEELKPMPCQKILSEIFKRNKIQFLANENDLGSICLSWNSINSPNYDINSNLNGKYAFNKYKFTLHEYISIIKKAKDYNVYFDKFDLDNLDVIGKSLNQKENSLKNKSSASSGRLYIDEEIVVSVIIIVIAIAVAFSIAAFI